MTTYNYKKFSIAINSELNSFNKEEEKPTLYPTKECIGQL